MGLSSSRLIYLALTLCFAVLAFMPQASATRWLDSAMAPTRVLGELASPIGLFARREAHAAEQSLAKAMKDEEAKSSELAALERYYALPDEDSLIAARHFVHAQVLRRFTEAPDRIECALEQPAGPELVVDLPVVLSNSYVGRVASVDRPHQRITVFLVTGKAFRVGANCADADPAEPLVAMVVGGLEPGTKRDSELFLSLHNPSRAGELSGVVRVDETLNAHAPFAGLSAGFRLGEVALSEAESTVAVKPDIDFKNGLFRVVVVLPGAELSNTPAREFDVFEAENWRMVRAYSACEPAHWREGVKIDLPRSAGARSNDAVVAGTRLVGFIARAGALDSDVSLLGDVGVSVPAQALVDLQDEPLVLGHLIALGRSAPGRPARFLWKATQPLARVVGGPTSRPARLFTGAGEIGVPRGLLIGEAMLPCGEGPHVIEVVEGVDARLLRKLWVWRGTERDELERERAP